MESKSRAHLGRGAIGISGVAASQTAAVGGNTMAEVLAAEKEIQAGDHQNKRIGVAVVSEVELRHPPLWRRAAKTKRQLHPAVRGFLRGNNANNTNLSPLYVNGNNAPSNANTNIAFGTWKPKIALGGSPARNNKTIRPYPAKRPGWKRQVQSLADVRAKQVKKRG